MIIKKVLTEGGVGVNGTCMVHGFTKNCQHYRIVSPDKLIYAEYS